MLYPEINKLRDAAGSRYFLVSMASKRARDIIDGSLKLDERIKSNKPVSIAAEEIAEGLFTYQMIEDTDDDSNIEEITDVSDDIIEADSSDILSTGSDFYNVDENISEKLPDSNESEVIF